MANVKELLKAEENGSLSFGDYSLTQKTKLDDFSFEGDTYKVKTFQEITRSPAGTSACACPVLQRE